LGQTRKRGTFYQIRYYRNGQRIEETTEHTKYDDARDELKRREGQISDGVPITAQSTRMKFDDAVQNVLADYTVNGNKTKDDVDRRIKKHLTPVFGGRRLSSVTVADLRAFTAKGLEGGGTPRGSARG